MPSPHVIVIGGGLAGLAASVALAGNDCRVSLYERSPRLGGRATSYVLPSGESIDNCQHVTLRCCTNLQDFYSRIGVADKIVYHDSLLFADSKGRRASMRLSGLPAPLHLTASFLKFSLLRWSDKRVIASVLLRIAAKGGRVKLPRAMSMAEWLKGQKQTPAAIKTFWRTVLVSALNEELDRMDAEYGIAVFWKAFLSNREGFVMGVPSVPLGELYSWNGGDVHTRSGVSELCFEDGRISGVRLDDGSIVRGDYYVAALPFDRLLKVLPAALRDEPPYVALKHLEVSPITGIHLWFDRSVMSEPFITSVDQTIQWVFNKDAGRYLQVVISASRELSSRSQQEIVDMCISELAPLIPASREATLLRSVVIRENAATFSPAPGCDALRPSQRTQISNFFLAGDWTQTGWPATMESAVRSGYLAAEFILAAEGRPTTMIQPELPPNGLLRWLR